MLQCLKREPGFYRYLWGLTGPIALQNLITFTLGLMDTLMVSWLGNTQMAAVTTANVPVFLLISIVFGVQSGLSILVSQYWGKRDMEHISRAIGVAAMLGTGLTVVLAGVAVPSVITAENGTVFRENLLFTHRGLSGPAVLQISSYWQPGEFVSINLLPDVDLETFLNEQRNAHPNQSLKNTLAVHLPKRLVERLQQLGQIPDVSLKQLNVRDQQTLISTLTDWRVQPNGTEGYRTAEVTLGGVDTNELSSRTMEARKVPGLYFIGEVMDVTGWLGGYNFQWAWSSAWACAQDLVAE